MALLILMVTSGALAAMATWWALQRLQAEYSRYRANFQHEAQYGLADFFLFLDPTQVWSANLAFAFSVGIIFLALGAHPLVGGGAGVVVLALPRWFLVWARRKRLQRVDEQLPDFLLALAGTLRAGAGLQSGVRQVVRHSPRPLAQEVGLLLQQQRMGLAFDEALDALHGRVPTESIGLVVSAVKVAGQTGGSLAETLERIASTLRTRHQLLGRIRALTSQGRMQAWIMALLPVLLGFALHALDPPAMSRLWKSAEGLAVLALIVFLEVAGLVLVRRIVNIEV